MVVAEGLAAVAGDIREEVMIVATTVDHILRLEEAVIVVVTEVGPEVMPHTEVNRSEMVEPFIAGTDRDPIDCTSQPRSGNSTLTRCSFIAGGA